MVDRWGIADGYRDAQGRWRETPRETRRALRVAMGADETADGPVDDAAVLVVEPGTPLQVEGAGELQLEEGTHLSVDSSLPPDLPWGYHRLWLRDHESPVLLIASPGRCYLPGFLRAWGWAVQLYAARSSGSWGIGDLVDLRSLVGWSAQLGAGLLLTNPLNAVLPVLSQQPSPYFPSTRRYRNPLYLRVEEVPGAANLGDELEALASAGRALNESRRIDRDAVFRLKMDALERLWSRFPGDPSFEQYRTEQGAGLREFATFCALAEHHGRGWRGWPAEYRHPDGPPVARFAADRAERVGFHQWLQWLVDEQLAAAAGQASNLLLMQDLPIGVDPDGADAWAWQDILAVDVSVGAPPDTFNTRGQDWGLPPFVPGRLRAAGYGPFIETIRATLRHAGGLRIDHVLGLFRLFWIPRGAAPSAGTYVRCPSDELLAVLALESHRAQAVVVGEDLGTVEEGVREQMAERQLLSYRVLWLDSLAPTRYPSLSLASVTTHDLATVAGLWSGTDLEAQWALGLEPNAEATLEMLERLQRLTGLAGDADIEEVVVRTHQLLARAPSVLVTAALEDALGVEERTNMPGTVAEWPNWSLALPLPLESVQSNTLVRNVAAALRRR